MQKKQLIFLLVALFLVSCNSNPAADKSADASNQMATSVALTLGASVAEMDTPIPDVSNMATPVPAPTGDPLILTTTYPDALPVEMQLVIGTLKLGETAQDITSEQATLLVPLWQALRSLIDAGNDQALITSQVTYILNTMTMDQVAAIAFMQLTQEDAASVSQALALEMGFGSGFGQISPEMQATMQAGRESGQVPSGNAGGPPPGMGPGGGQGMRTEGSGASTGISPALIDAVIELLGSKIP